MPFLKTLNKKQKTENLFQVSTSRKGTRLFKLQVNPGFTLIEILLSLFLILALVTILLTTSSTFISSRGSNLQGIAAKIASCEIERLRNLVFASLPSTGPVDPACNADLSKLPQGTATRTVADYQNDPDIKQVTVQVDWTVSGAAKQVKVETLIYKNGL